MQIRVEKEVYIPYDSGEKQNKTQADFFMTVQGGHRDMWGRLLERNHDRLEGKDFSIHLVMSPLINRHILINYILFIPRL